MSNGLIKFQIRNYGREQKHLPNNTLRKGNGAGHALDWNPQGSRKRSRPKRTTEWELQKAGEAGKRQKD
jgi:hypothetical protein